MFTLDQLKQQRIILENRRLVLSNEHAELGQKLQIVIDAISAHFKLQELDPKIAEFYIEKDAK